MDSGIGIFILVIVALIFINAIVTGYKDASKPPIQTRDTGNGVMEPICPKCQAKLVLLTREKESGLLSIVSVLIGLIGIVLFLLNWLVGGVVLILAILINFAGKGKSQVLSCPVCGYDAKTLN